RRGPPASTRGDRSLTPTLGRIRPHRFPSYRPARRRPEGATLGRMPGRLRLALVLAAFGLGSSARAQPPRPTPSPAPKPSVTARLEYCSLLRKCGLSAPAACSEPLTRGVPGVDYDSGRCGPARELSQRGVDPADPASFRLFRFLGERYQVVYRP